MAKAAMVVAGRVVNCSGGGNAGMLLDAIEWIIQRGTRPAVVNMSLGCGDVQAVRDAATPLFNAGYVPVSAAGNGDVANNPIWACREAPAGSPPASPWARRRRPTRRRRTATTDAAWTCWRRGVW